MKKVFRLRESELRNIIKETINGVLREDFDDDELRDELDAVGARGGKPTEQQIFSWEEDLWINVNKALQNATYLFNKTRDERYAKIESAISEALSYFPDDAHMKYMAVDYDPDRGYGG